MKTHQRAEQNNRAEKKRQPRLASAMLVAAAALLLFNAAAWAQAAKPISREGLVKAVKINGLSTAELIQQIQTRGVSFQMTPDAEAELRSAGARPPGIKGARSNYPTPPLAHTRPPGRNKPN